MGRPRKERKPCARPGCNERVKYSRKSATYCSNACAKMVIWDKKSKEEKLQFSKIQSAKANQQANVVRLKARIEKWCAELGIPLTPEIYRFGVRMRSHSYLSGYHAARARCIKLGIWDVNRDR